MTTKIDYGSGPEPIRLRKELPRARLFNSGKIRLTMAGQVHYIHDQKDRPAAEVAALLINGATLPGDET